MTKIKDEIINFLKLSIKSTEKFTEDEESMEITPESLHAQQKFVRSRHAEYPCTTNKKKKMEQ